MLGHLALAGEVLGACQLVGKYAGDQVFGTHARELRCNFLAAFEAGQRQRHAGNPAPAGEEHRRIEQCLGQHLGNPGGIEVARDLAQLEAVRRGQRQNDAVLGRRRLQLEIELAAKPLAQGQAPGAIDAAAVRRVDHELHAAGFIEEALQHDRLPRRQAPERGLRGAEVLDELRGRLVGHAELGHQPKPRCAARRIVAEPRCYLGAKARHGDRELVAASRRLAEPEGDGRRRALRVLDAHQAALDAQDAVGRIAQLEDIAGQAFHSKVLVHRPDDDALRLEKDLEVGVVGDGAARGQRREPGAPTTAEHPVDGIAMEKRAAPASPRRKAVGEHRHNGIELGLRERAIRPSTAAHGIELLLAPLAACDLGNDLLGQDVEGMLRDRQPVELAAPGAVEQACAFHQVVAR